MSKLHFDLNFAYFLFYDLNYWYYSVKCCLIG